MRSSRTVRAVAATLLAAVVVVVPGEAQATPAYLTDQISPFGTDPVPSPSGDNIAVYGTPVEMASDGTLLVGRAITGGTTEVAVKRPGQDVVRTTLVAATGAGSYNSRLVVATGPGGALAAVWNSDGYHLRVVLQPAGTTTWTTPIDVPGTNTGVGSVTFGPDGRLWVVAPDLVSGVSVNRVQVLPATGAGPLLTTTVPRPAVGFDTLPRLVVGRDGTGHLASQREVRTQDASTCSFDSSVVTADFAAGDATAQTVVRAAYQHAGTVSGTTCTLSSTTGDEVAQRVEEAVGPDDGISVVYTVSHYGSGGSSGAFALHLPARGIWGYTPETVRTGNAYFSGAGLFRLGGTTAAVLNGSGGTTLNFRTPAGTWTSEALSPGAYVAGAGSTAGTAVFAYTDGLSPYATHAQSIAPDGTASPPVDVGTGGALLRAVSDADGNAVVAYRTSGAVLKLLRFDASGPRLSTAGFPRTALPGQAVTFTADDVDVWSGPATTPAWTFDDGGTASGHQVTHAFTTPGEHTVTVTASDQLGNVTTRTAPVTVTAPVLPPPTPPVVPDTTAPLVAAARVSPARPTAREPGTLGFTSSEAGSTTVTLTGTAKGVRQGKKCVAPGRVTGKRCTRALPPRSLTLAATGGAQGVTLPTLAAGSWTATVSVADAAGNRGQTTATFTVKAARKAKKAAKKAAKRA